MFNIIAAVDEARGMGRNGSIPWKAPGEQKYFKALTAGAARGYQNAIIMGRKTWESLPESFRPLPDRINILVTSRDILGGGFGWTASSLDSALDLAQSYNDIGDIYVIGGGQLYAEAAEHPELDRIYLTHVDGIYDCDVFFPKLSDNWVVEDIVAEGKGWRAAKYRRINL